MAESCKEDTPVGFIYRERGPAFRIPVSGSISGLIDSGFGVQTETAAELMPNFERATRSSPSSIAAELSCARAVGFEV